MNKPFVAESSIVRTIWGNSDTVLFIFAGSAAEFALNKAVDWLYFTGKLPANPIERLFSTVSYARRIIFSEEEKALTAIDNITAIHTAVETKRNANIPDWAYRDVLFMLIHYSIASFEVLQRKLTEDEAQEIYSVFFRLGSRMHLKELPKNYHEWLPVREQHLQKNLIKSSYTKDLFKQYKKHLGLLRFIVLIEVQKLVTPRRVKDLLSFGQLSFIKPLLLLYKASRRVNLDWFLKSLLLPVKYKQRIKDLDIG